MSRVSAPETACSDRSAGHELLTYIFPDFKAVEYFRHEFVALNEFHIIEETEAAGFEIYLVDSWIRQRKIGSVVSVFTGNPQSVVKVCKFTTAKHSSENYPPRFQEYLNELLFNHATFKKMDNLQLAAPEAVAAATGSDIPQYLLVTNTAALPHNLNLIPIPGGDAKAVGRTFAVNSNLKTFNCGGRSLSLLATKVSDASEDKFRNMYRITNDNVPVQFAILELVNVVQMCLFYYDLLDARYADGLLCEKTEDAINNWWNLIGLPHYNTKPDSRSGVFSAKTVAAIISITVSVRLRLHLFGGCDVPKDPFDFENFMLSIGQLQKQINLEKKRKLDLLTLSRLFYYTNQSYSAEKFKSANSAFGRDLLLDDNDSSVALDSTATPLAPKTNNTGLRASAYRRNKLYYSKELKKLTNVVKNTVQDHIMVKEDGDDIYAEPTVNKSSQKLRSKLASKLTDNVVPSDLETIDIDIFVKRCIVGRTLRRLWFGLSEDAETHGKGHTSQQPEHHRRHRHSERKHYPHIPSEQRKQYVFVSFRDSIAADQGLPVAADKSGRLGRMKNAFQNRKSTKLEPADSVSSRRNRQDSGKQNTVSLLQAELQRITDEADSSFHEDAAGGGFEKTVNKTGLYPILNRRTSYPFAHTSAEVSLNVMELLQEYQLDLALQRPKLRNRSKSFSLVEDSILGNEDLASMEKVKRDYVFQASQLFQLDQAQKQFADGKVGHFNKEFKQLNLDLMKVHNMETQMLARKTNLHTEFAAMLDKRMRDLGENLDRMAFRSRDLLKTIDELDHMSAKFDSKLHDECVGKLHDTVERLVHSCKFRSVFGPEKRKKIVVALTGREEVSAEDDEAPQRYWAVRVLVVFFYDMMLMLLRMFNFDRSRMNLERIRSQYNKLDPNRRYISNAYKFVGRDSHSERPEPQTPPEVAT